LVVLVSVQIELIFDCNATTQHLNTNQQTSSTRRSNTHPQFPNALSQPLAAAAAAAKASAGTAQALQAMLHM